MEKILRDKDGAFDKSVPYEKLVKLLIGLRDGIAADIRVNAENAKTNASAQSVLADLIEGQIARGRGTLTAVKWDPSKPISTANGTLTATERKELSNLVAALIMRSLDDTFNTAWSAFEAKGYQSVEFSFSLDSARGSLSPIVESLNNGLNLSGSTIDVGFKVTQNVTAAS